MVITQNDLHKKHRFYTHGHISGPKKSPDMILNAFHVKFHDNKMKYLPGLNKIENQQIPKTSFLRRWYTQFPIPHPHRSNKALKINSGGSLRAE